MHLGDVYAVYNCDDSIIESVHAFEYLAIQHRSFMLEADQNLSKENFVITTLDTAIAWVTSDATQQALGYNMNH